MTSCGGSSPGASSVGTRSAERAEPVAQDLGQLQEADRRAVGERQEALARRLGRGHRPDVQVGHVAHVGDAEALARARPSSSRPASP